MKMPPMPFTVTSWSGVPPTVRLDETGQATWRPSPSAICGCVWLNTRQATARITRSLHIESATKLVRTGPRQTRDCVLRYLQALGYP